METASNREQDARARRLARAKVVLSAALSIAALGYLTHEARSVRNDDALRRVDRAPGEPRFGGLDLATRKSIYESLASRHPVRVQNARMDFPTHVWSQYDHYANLLHREVQAIAAVRQLHYTQVLLVFDEGVRKGWRARNGAVIPPIWEPLRPRTQ